MCFYQETRYISKMKINIKVLSEDNVREIFSWRYTEPYSIYNMPSMAEAINNKYAILQQEIREKDFFGLYLDDCFIGYFHLYMPSERKVMLGVGLSPEFCGHGYGELCMVKIIEYIKNNFLYKSIILVVRSFNSRAIKCYQRVGFIKTDSYEKEVGEEKVEYYKMEMQL